MPDVPPAPPALLAAEAALLRTLTDRRWRTRAELAEDTGLLPAAAAAILPGLEARGLVCRSMAWRSIGQWRITASGLDLSASSGEVIVG